MSKAESRIPSTAFPIVFPAVRMMSVTSSGCLVLTLHPWGSLTQHGCISISLSSFHFNASFPCRLHIPPVEVHLCPSSSWVVRLMFLSSSHGCSLQHCNQCCYSPSSVRPWELPFPELSCHFCVHVCVWEFMVVWMHVEDRWQSISSVIS